MIKTQGTGILPTEKILGTNRTGATLTLGGVYAIDITGGATESTDPDSNTADIVACATGNLRGFLVVADAATVDDAVGVFTLKGRCKALVDGTTDVAEGDALIPQNASPNLIKQAGLFVACGMALEAQATDAGTLTDIYFDGEALFKSEKAVS
jgi:hypothetical protein